MSGQAGTGTRGHGRLRDRRTWFWPFNALGSLAGFVVADQLLAGFGLGGPPARQLTTAAFLTAVHIVAGVVVSRVLRRVLRGSGRAALLSIALSPGLLWLAVRLGPALGLPVALTGFWSVVGVCVLVDGAGMVAGLGYALAALAVTRPEHRWWSVGVLVDVVGGLAGLWIATATLDGVRVGPEPVAARLFTMVVLTALFLSVSRPVRLTVANFPPWTTRAAHAAVVLVDTVVATLVLRGLGWLSSFTPVAVSVGGVGTSLLTVVLMTAVPWVRQVPGWVRLERPRGSLDRANGVHVGFGGLLRICLLAGAVLVGYGLWALFS